MALSNWDILAIDENGNPTNGVFETPLGIKAEIYKNWVYIHDEKAWREKGGFVKDVVMEVNNGKIHYMDLNLFTEFSEEHNAIFVMAWNGWKYDNTLKAMYGIGAYGFDGDVYVGISKQCFEDFQKFVARSVEFYTHAELPDFSKALRFNQGDSFFDCAFDEEPMGTKVGEQEEPYLIQMFK
jgi:hypothetical protein